MNHFLILLMPTLSYPESIPRTRDLRIFTEYRSLTYEENIAELQS